MYITGRKRPGLETLVSAYGALYQPEKANMLAFGTQRSKKKLECSLSELKEAKRSENARFRNSKKQKRSESACFTKCRCVVRL